MQRNPGGLRVALGRIMQRRRLPMVNPAEQLTLFGSFTGPDLLDVDAVPVGSVYEEEPGPSCVRSPCVSMGRAWDPKVSMEQVDAARLQVGEPKLRRGMVSVMDDPTGAHYTRGAKKGQPKTRPVPVWQDTVDYYRPGASAWPLAISYGIGIDSTAILVGLAQIYRETGDPRYRPQWITFADVGAEKQSTYAYLPVLNRWLESIGFPQVTTVAWSRFGGSRSWGSHRTLEQNCLNNHTMPSISASKFTRSECSVTWKHDPQDRWFKDHSGFFVLAHSENCSSRILDTLAEVPPGHSLHLQAIAERSKCSAGQGRIVLRKLAGAGFVTAAKEGRSFAYRVTGAGMAAAADQRLLTTRNVMPQGVRIIKAIGYDATEEARLDTNAVGSTFRAGDGDDAGASDYAYWYPLMEWGWDRSRCYAEIEAEIGPTWQSMADAGELDPKLLPGPVPGKSSCFFCGAMKPEEIRHLSKEDVRRALLLELVALRGRNPSSVKGLAVNWSWWDFASGREAKEMPERAREQIREFGPLLPQADLDRISALANEWLSRSAPAKGMGDISEVGHEMGLLAFSKMRGLRGDPGQLGWDLFEEKRGKALANPPMPYDPLLEGS